MRALAETLRPRETEFRPKGRSQTEFGNEGLKNLLKGSVAFGQLTKVVPPDMSAQLQAIYRDSMHEDYHPENDFRDAAKSADEHDTAYRHELDELKSHWPERTDRAFLHRLETLTPAGLHAWQKELDAAISTLEARKETDH